MASTLGLLRVPSAGCCYSVFSVGLVLFTEYHSWPRLDMWAPACWARWHHRWTLLHTSVLPIRVSTGSGLPSGSLLYLKSWPPQSKGTYSQILWGEGHLVGTTIVTCWRHIVSCHGLLPFCDKLPQICTILVNYSPWSYFVPGIYQKFIFALSPQTLLKSLSSQKSPHRIHLREHDGIRNCRIRRIRSKFLADIKMT